MKVLLANFMVFGAGLIGVCMLVGVPAVAQSLTDAGPSFSCMRAPEGGVEQLICSSADLARQDQVMARSFLQARDAVRGSEGLGELLTSQQAWLRERAACADLRTQKGYCISETTRTRIAELQQWQRLAMNPARAQRTRPGKTGTTKGSRPPIGPSYNCANARTSVERTICDNRDLSRHDRQVASLHARLMGLVAGNSAQTSLFQGDQRGFIANRNRCDRRPQVILACLQVSYENRVMRLDELIGEISSRP